MDRESAGQPSVAKMLKIKKIKGDLRYRKVPIFGT